jgi:hypothetical protein
MAFVSTPIISAKISPALRATAPLKTAIISSPFTTNDGTETAGDLAFVAAARAAMTEGYTIFYNSWW